MPTYRNGFSDPAIQSFHGVTKAIFTGAHPLVGNQIIAVSALHLNHIGPIPAISGRVRTPAIFAGLIPEPAPEPEPAIVREKRHLGPYARKRIALARAWAGFFEG